MAVYNNLVLDTYTAGADLSAKQYYFVKRSGADVVVCGAGEAAAGVLTNNPVSGGAASVAYGGSPMVLAGGTITAGAAVMSSSAGKALAWTTTNNLLGFAREAAVDGQYIQIDFFRGGNLT